MPSSRSLPPALAARAREFVAGGLTAVRPRPAATVVLLRDSPAGVEVYLAAPPAEHGLSPVACRHSPAAPSTYAMPTTPHSVGLVHPRRYGRTRLGTSEPVARGFVSAAVRETFEEAGVLLAAGPDGTPVDAAGSAWENDRRALVERRLALSELLETQRTSPCRRACFGRGLTGSPRGSSRAGTTPGSSWPRCLLVNSARDVSGEADRAFWTRPAKPSLQPWPVQVAMLPPTWAVLEELANYDAVADALAAADGPRVETVMPGWVEVTARSELCCQTTRVSRRRPRRPGGRADVMLPPWCRLVQGRQPRPDDAERHEHLCAVAGAAGNVVVDPGPLLDEHLQAVAALGPVAVTLLTHGHLDHAEGPSGSMS